MKKIELLSVAMTILINTHLIGQEFSFQLIFNDAKGNFDTLILGYDPNASDSVDLEFGEINIINENLDSIFDVRITDEWKARQWENDTIGKYHLKKQITKKRYGNFIWPISLDIKCNNWPVTAKWDRELFDNPNRNGSVMTSQTPGGWWDVTGSPSNMSRIEMEKQDSVTFTSNWDEYLNENYAYTNKDQDTISVFWFVFADSTLLLDIDENEVERNPIIYPNPTTDKIKFSGINIEKIDRIIIQDLSGKQYNVKFQYDTINTTNLKKGIYFLKILFYDKKILTRKFIKI